MIYTVSLKEVLALGSMFADEHMNRLTVGDKLPDIHMEILLTRTDQYHMLKESMKYYGQLVPLHVSKDKMRLKDGLHRVAIASDLGWRSIELSTEKHVCMEWNHSEAGAEYYRLWNERLLLRSLGENSPA
jgi:hypothetical protein